MRILTVIPTYNEADSIAATISEVLRQTVADGQIDVLVVDDSSPDGTARIVSNLAQNEPRIHILHRPRKLGLGTAYVEGFRFALAQKYDFVVQMDADLSHDPGYLPDFLGRMADCDLVVGSRYLRGVSIVNWPFWRLVYSYSGNFLARRFTGLPLTDLTSGYKCFRTEVVRDTNLARLRSNGYAFQIEFTWRIWQSGGRVREIPILFVDRRVGQSKMTAAVAVEAFILLLRLSCERAFRLATRTARHYVHKSRPDLPHITNTPAQ